MVCLYICLLYFTLLDIVAFNEFNMLHKEIFICKNLLSGNRIL